MLVVKFRLRLRRGQACFSVHSCSASAQFCNEPHVQIPPSLPANASELRGCRQFTKTARCGGESSGLEAVEN